MRKIDFSSKELSRIRFSSRAEARSRPEGLLDDDAGALAQPDLASCSTTSPNSEGGNGEIVRRALGRAELPCGCACERRRILVVAIDVAQQAGELGERGRIEPAVLLEAVLRPGLELLEVPARLGHADDRHVEVAALRPSPAATGRSSCRPDRRWRRRRRGRRTGTCSRQLLEAARYLPPASRGVRRTRSASPRAACPANSASPRELKRSYSAAVRTGAGTASSMAALIVQRPSPESETRPANFERVGILEQGRSPSGPAATRRSRCRAATPRRCRAG